MRTVAIVNQKGGCGKTTTAISLAGVYASQGLRVLLVDMDPQSHCAAGLGIPEKRIDLDITDALGSSPAASLDLTKLIWKPSRNLDLSPSRMRLAGLEALRGGLADREDRHQRLAGVLTRVADQYDICLVDCSPAIGLLTYNALAAACTALIPVETSFFSLQGASRQVSTVRSMARHLSQHLRMWLLATLHDPSSGLASDLLDELNRRFGDAVCPHTVRHDARLKEAASIGKTISQYAPDSTGAEDYTQVAAWLKPKLFTRAIEHHADTLQALDPAASEAEAEALERPSGIVRVMTNVESGALAQKLSGKTVASASPGTGSPVHTAVAEHAATSSPGNVAEQIASDLRARAATRAEEMARLAQRLAGRTPASGGNDLPPHAPDAAQPHPVLHEVKPEPFAGVPPVNLPLGFRQTSQGALFVLPAAVGESVSIAADFNGWSTTRHAMKRNTQLGVFELCIPLPPGRYTYRLVIDGRWQVDPFNPTTEPNPFGEANSVAWMKEPSPAV